MCRVVKHLSKGNGPTIRSVRASGGETLKHTRNFTHIVDIVSIKGSILFIPPTCRPVQTAETGNLVPSQAGKIKLGLAPPPPIFNAWAHRGRNSCHFSETRLSVRDIVWTKYVRVRMPTCLISTIMLGCVKCAQVRETYSAPFAEPSSTFAPPG